MADNNIRHQEFSPEYIAILEQLAKDRLDPKRSDIGAGYGNAILGLLNALGGQTGLAHTNALRYRQQQDIGRSNIPRRGRPSVTPIQPRARPQSTFPINGSTVEENNLPPVIAPPRPPAPMRPSRPVQPQGGIQPPRQPSVAGRPASVAPGALETGSATPPQDLQSPLTYEQGENVVRDAMSVRGQRGFNIENDMTEFSRLVGRQPTHVDRFFVEKYGPQFVAALYTNPQAPLQGVFQQYYDRLGTPDEAFINAVPTEQRNITAGEWFSDQIKGLMGGRFGNVNRSSVADVSVPNQQQVQDIINDPTQGGRDVAQPNYLGGPREGSSGDVAQLTDVDQASDFLTETTPAEAQPLTRPQSQQPQRPLPAGGATGGLGGGMEGSISGGASGGAQGPVTQSNVPSITATRKPAHLGRIRVLEDQFQTVYPTMSEEEKKSMREEYANLTKPITEQFGDISASYKYNYETGEFELVPESITRRPGTFQVGGESFTGVQGGGNRVNIPQYGTSGRPANQGGVDYDESAPPQPSRPQHPLFPGGRQTGNLPSDLEHYRQEQRITGETRSRAVANEDNALNAALESYDLSIPLRADLGFIRTLTEQSGPFSEGGMYRGPGADWIQAALRVLKNFGVDIPATNVVQNAEGIKKVIVQLGSQATRQLSNRPANFEFQTILNAFPGLEVSYEGANLLLDYLDQVQERMQETGRAAEQYMQRPVDQRGGWRRIVGELDRVNPIMVTIPAGNWLMDKYGIDGPIRLTTRKITETEERVLPSDVYFFRNGKLRRGDGSPSQPRQ